RYRADDVASLGLVPGEHSRPQRGSHLRSRGSRSLMDWGIHLPQLGRQASRDALIRFAQRAAQVGYHSVWVSDHIAWPHQIASKYPYSDDGSFAPAPDMRWLDPLGT